ncbi:hypothetical protein [Dinoroseobacter sp. S124A]|uniref:hypothetical protein n=1 Tax=Dinoroseobacter sp. S124A TaxID=3415128 RepID=UPI003C7BB18A
MKAQDFLAWTEVTGLTSARQAALALDASRNKMQSWFADAKAGRDVPVNRVTRLAMTALAN